MVTRSKIKAERGGMLGNLLIVGMILGALSFCGYAFIQLPSLSSSSQAANPPVQRFQTIRAVGPTYAIRRQVVNGTAEYFERFDTGISNANQHAAYEHSLAMLNAVQNKTNRPNFLPNPSPYIWTADKSKAYIFDKWDAPKLLRSIESEDQDAKLDLVMTN